MTKKNYPIHPAAALWPMMSKSELRDLAASIVAIGQREPIRLHRGQVIDGRNRLEACRLAHVEPRFADAELHDADPYDYVWSLNGERRHLSKAQLAAIKVESLKASGEWDRREAEAKARADAARSEVNGGRKPQDKRKDCAPPAGATKPRSVAVEVASEIGVSPRTVQNAKELSDKAPELSRKVAAGKATMGAARKAAGLDASKPKAPPAPRRLKSDFVTDPGSFAGIGGPPLTRTPPPPPPPSPPPELDDDEPGVCEDDFDLDEEQHAGLRRLNPPPEQPSSSAWDDLDDLERGFDNPVNGGTTELPDGTPTHMQFIMFANDPEVARAVTAAEASGNPILATVLRAGFEALGLVKPLPPVGS